MIYDEDFTVNKPFSGLIFSKILKFSRGKCLMNSF